MKPHRARLFGIYERKGFSDEPAVRELGRCIQRAFKPGTTGTACRNDVNETEKPKGPLKASDPACRSERSVCAYSEAKEREYCAATASRCARRRTAPAAIHPACARAAATPSTATAAIGRTALTISKVSDE